MLAEKLEVLGDI